MPASKRFDRLVRQLVAAWALIAWAHVLFAVWPPPPRPEVLSVELQWALWWESVAFVVFGVAAAFLAFRAVRLWWVAILLTSGAWLTGSLPQMIGDILSAPSFQAWITPFLDTMKATSLYFLLVVPLYHVVLVCAALIYGVTSIAVRLRANAAVA
jgi:hypothetical protein